MIIPITGGPPLPADSEQDDAEQVKEERETGEVFVHPHHPQTGEYQIKFFYRLFDHPLLRWEVK